MLTRQAITTLSVLRQLMDESNLSEAELARQVNVPQTTINRLLNSDVDARANTLRPIARYFNVTIGQLLGDEPLSLYRIVGETNPSSRAIWRNLPIITWEQIQGWRFKYQDITPFNHKRWIITERDMSEESFALISKPYMEPRFRENSILLIDPKAKAREGHFVIISINGAEPTVRRILHDGDTVLLEHLRAGQETQVLTRQMIIHGVILESRLVYDSSID